MRTVVGRTSGGGTCPHGKGRHLPHDGRGVPAARHDVVPAGVHAEASDDVDVTDHFGHGLKLG